MSDVLNSIGVPRMRLYNLCPWYDQPRQATYTVLIEVCHSLTERNSDFIANIKRRCWPARRRKKKKERKNSVNKLDGREPHASAVLLFGRLTADIYTIDYSTVRVPRGDVETSSGVFLPLA
jgi:hypothetical protein